MNKNHDNHPDNEINVEQEPTGEIYYFPNEGGITSFSCKADSRKEAEERNQEHLEQLKKEGN